MPVMAAWIERDMKFVRGRMTPQEEEQHIKAHWELTAARDKELQEYMARKKAEAEE